MEIEIKIRIPNEQEFIKLKNALKDCLVSTFEQKNYFIDTVDMALEAEWTVFRLRHENSVWKAAVKSKPKLENGISKVQEREKEISDIEAMEILRDPQAVNQSEHVIVKEIKGKKEYKLVGSFETTRRTYHYDELKLELDETRYDFGVAYELECEHNNPEKTKLKMYSKLT